MRPNVLWGYSFYVIAAEFSEESGREDERTAAEIRDELLALRDSKAPITMVDPMGIEHVGYITSISGQPAYRIPGEDEESDVMEMRYLCNFAEVSRG